MPSSGVCHAELGWSGLAQVAVENVHPPPEAQEVYQGVAAPKRKRVNEQTEVGEMPKVRCWKESAACVQRLPTLP